MNSNFKKYTQSELDELRRKAYESELKFSNLVRQHDVGISTWKTDTAPMLFSPLVAGAEKQQSTLTKVSEDVGKQQSTLTKVYEDVEKLRSENEFRAQIDKYMGLQNDELLGLIKLDRKKGLQNWFIFGLTDAIYGVDDKNNHYWIYFRYPGNVIVSHIRKTSYSTDLVLDCPEDLIRILFMNATDVNDKVKEDYLKIVDYVLQDELKEIRGREIVSKLYHNKKFREWIEPKYRDYLGKDEQEEEDE